MLKESKSQLAKLMATENVDVQHQQISTAKFDPKNRVLYLPIWKDMDGSLYDLLCGHEVGHALFTPADGWHDAVVDKNKPKNYKNFLNVVEDARIEKKVQRKYPGLRRSFAEAYKGLLKKDFFGLDGRDPNKLPFIDRLNLFTKSQYTLPIDFNEQETKLLEKAKSTESWEEVVKVTDEIYAYSKEEQLEYENELSFDDFDIDEEEGEEESLNDNQNTVTPSGDQGEEEEDDSGSSNTQANENGEEDEEEEETQSIINRDKESADVEDSSEFEPACQTDETYRQKENSLIDDKCKPRTYLEFPKANLKNIITPVKRVQELLTEDFQRQIKLRYFTQDTADNLLAEFKKKNDKYISLLAKEFEMKKAAKVFSKKKVANTGDLDINKLASYKFDDNIFKKVMMLPKGKSHGLVLLLDYSGSMFENLSGSIEQVLILSAFCKKVNIPFVVYNFGYSETTHAADLGKELIEIPQSFEKKVNQVHFSNVRIREYLNSNMRTSDYNNAIKNLLLLKQAWTSYKNRYSVFDSRVYVPNFEQLTNTPLTQAMYVMGHIVPEFKKQNNLDLVNLVIVHDGDADSTNYQTAVGDPFKGKDDQSIYSKYLDWDTIYVLTDKKNRFSGVYDLTNQNEKSMYQIMCDWFKQKTNAKIVGFYIVPPTTRYVKDAIKRQYVSKSTSVYGHRTTNLNSEELEINKIFRKEKLLVSKKPGYDDFYLILGGSNLNVENENIEVTGKITSAKLKSAFLKMNKGKQVNRVLVSKFIEKIAA